MPSRRKPTPEDLKAKAEFFRAYFDDFEDKISFAASLYDQGRKDEAFILTSSYIEAMGTYLMSPGKGSRENFCHVLLQHGGEPNLELVHPRSLVRAMSGKGPAADKLAAKLESLGPSVISEMRPIQDFIDNLANMLDEEEIALLRQHVHLGTLASVAYKGFRSRFVHRGGGPKFISFDETSFSGGSAPELDFGTLMRALRRLVAHARSSSEPASTQFGQD